MRLQPQGPARSCRTRAVTQGAGAGFARRARLLALTLTAALLAGATLANAASAKPAFHDTLTCQSVTYNWTGFGEGEHAMTLKVKVDGQRKPYAYESRYHFTGDSGSVTVPVAIPVGRHEVTAYAEYEGGESDYRLPPIECGPNDAISIEKLQEVAGSGSGYTTAEVVTNPGQQLSYKFIVKNTGNQTLLNVVLGDPQCEPLSITGGPSGAFKPGEVATFYCTRTLGGPGTYTNVGQVAGTPEGGGGPTVAASNEVVARVVTSPSIAIEKLQEIVGSGKGFTKEELAANVGQVVSYKILITNTGATPVTLSALKDAHCDKGTLAGGPGALPLGPGETTTYTCSHTFKLTDNNKVYANTAATTATGEGGATVTDSSNTVLVEVPVPKPRVKHVVTCNSITTTLTGFPQRPGNQVVIRVKIDGQTKPFAYEKHLTFDGSTVTVTFPVSIPAGHHEITIYVEWQHPTNGLPAGESDYRIIGGVTCPFVGNLQAEKSQRVVGGGGFTTSTLSAFAGQTVEYRVVVTNATNAPLTLGALSDEGCDPGTVSGGPGASPLGIGASTTYTCTRLLSGPGPWTNTASIAGTPPVEVGGSVTAVSNTVTAQTPI